MGQNRLSYSANTFLPLNGEQPFCSGQISWSQCVLYTEVQLYSPRQLNPCYTTLRDDLIWSQLAGIARLGSVYILILVGFNSISCMWLYPGTARGF